MQKRLLMAVLVMLVTAAQAQWLSYPAPGTPRTAGGKPNLSARAPRASNGKPDLSGVWQTEPASEEDQRLFPGSGRFAVPGDDPRIYNKYSRNILVDFNPNESPLRREAKVERAELCVPLGLPLADLFNFAPFKVIQTPGLIAVLYETDNTYRQIYADGRKLPIDPQPAWLGYSVGK